MFPLQIPIQRNKDQNKSAIKNKLKQWVFVEQLNNIPGYLFFTIVALVVAVGIATMGLIFGILLLVAAVAVPVIVGLVIYPKFGVIVYLTMAFSVMFLLKLGIPFPLGTLMDGFLVLFILGLFIQQKKKTDWQILKGPVTTCIIIWIGYNIIEIANPVAESKMAWVFTIRTLAFVTMMYFIFIYNIRTKEQIRLILKIWLAFMFIAAVYAYKQEFIGFFSFEEQYNNSEGVPGLLYIAGHWRKYSIFSDPVTFAYNMAIASLVCIGLLTRPLRKAHRIILFLLIFILLSSMLFSGTRGAFPLVPASLILYAILKLSKKIVVATAIAAVFIIGLIFVPTSNQNILRFQSAFRPNDDASYKVRQFNQARIKPYIWSHPIGGGLGSTGEWGKSFSPGSYLASFPPDSGYVRTTVELGWIGLTIFCILMFVIIKTGIDNYYKIKDPELKSYCLAMVLTVFAWNIANFPQEALVQYPSNVVIYLAVALINITHRIDKQQQRIEIQ